MDELPPTTALRQVVVGADNFIGRRLVGALSPRGRVESLTSRDTPRNFARALADADVVVVCEMGRPATIVRSMQRTLDAARMNAKIPRIVNFSSMAVYGAARGLVSESHAPEGALSDYAAARLTAERSASVYPRVVTLRPGCEYGPGCPHWGERAARWLMARRIGDLGANGDGVCNLLYIEDLERAVIRATELPDIDGQVFNLAGDDPPTWNEFFTRFAIALGAVPVRRVTQRRLQIETRLMAIPLRLGELVAKRAGLRRSPLPPAIPPSLITQCRQEIRLDNGNATRVLGMTWTPLDAGLRATAIALRHPAG